MVSDAQLNNAVQIINDLSKSGPIRPSHDTQLEVSSHYVAVRERAS